MFAGAEVKIRRTTNYEPYCYEHNPTNSSPIKTPAFPALNYKIPALAASRGPAYSKFHSLSSKLLYNLTTPSFQSSKFFLEFRTKFDFVVVSSQTSRPPPPILITRINVSSLVELNSIQKEYPVLFLGSILLIIVFIYIEQLVLVNYVHGVHFWQYCNTRYLEK